MTVLVHMNHDALNQFVRDFSARVRPRAAEVDWMAHCQTWSSLADERAGQPNIRLRAGLAGTRSRLRIKSAADGNSGTC